MPGWRRRMLGWCQMQTLVASFAFQAEVIRKLEDLSLLPDLLRPLG